MADIKTFHLPDLGEGLPDATIVEWLVKEGDIVKLDEPLVSMETAKAVVEVPSPFSGKLAKVHGGAGDVIVTGAALAEFEIDPNLPQRAEAESTGHHHAPSAQRPARCRHPGRRPAGRDRVRRGRRDRRERRLRTCRRRHGGRRDAVERPRAQRTATAVGGVKAVPAVRALAKQARRRPRPRRAERRRRRGDDEGRQGRRRRGNARSAQRRQGRCARAPLPQPATPQRSALGGPGHAGRRAAHRRLRRRQADAHDAADGGRRRASRNSSRACAATWRA